MDSEHAFTFITILCKQCYMQPRVVEKVMRKYLINTNKYQNKLWSKIVLDRLKRDCTGTNDVQQFSFSQLKRTQSIDEFNEYVHSNLNIKRRHAIKMEAKAKQDMILAKIELKKLINLNTLAGIEFTKFIDNQWNIGWKQHEKCCKEKIAGLKSKQVKILKNM